MRRIAVLLAVLACAAAAAAFVARAGAARTASSFRTPDAGAACRLERSTLVCSSLASPGSVVLAARGASVVRRLPWWDASTPVLHRWAHGSIACHSAGAAILCRSGGTTIRVTGGGFAVAG